MSCSQIGNAPHTYFFLAFPSPDNVIRGPCPHERVHFYVKDFLNTECHISREVGLSRLDNVGRETPIAMAAAVTVKPAGSIISVRMKSPGWACHCRAELVAIQPLLGVQLSSSFASPPKFWRGTAGQGSLGDRGRVEGPKYGCPCKSVPSFAYQGFWDTAESR